MTQLRAALPFAVLLLLMPATAQAQAARSLLIDQAAANRHGLKRAWFAQIDVGSSRSRIVDIKFDGGTVFVQTGIATTHAIDGETGRTLWMADVGVPNHPSLPLGVSDKRVAVLNGTTLYVLNRGTGQVEFTHSIRGVPIVGAALSDETVFVPTTGGQVEVYSLVDEDHRNLSNLRLEGRDLTQPAVGYLGVAVGSGRGDLGLASLSGTSFLFRLPTNFGFVAAPAAWGPKFYAGNMGGLLYAFDDISGREQWSFAAGSGINQSPVPIGDAVYVLCEDLSMFRVSAETGREEWMAKNVRTFLAASPTRIYTIDHLGRMVTLSAKTGSAIDMVSMPPSLIPVTNRYTDQIFVATETGLIQSLHEIELTKRMDYRPPTKEDSPAKEGSGPTSAKKAGKSKSATKSATSKAMEKGKAAPQAAPQPAPLADPFGPAPDKAAPAPKAEADPFGPGR